MNKNMNNAGISSKPIRYKYSLIAPSICYICIYHNAQINLCDSFFLPLPLNPV